MTAPQDHLLREEELAWRRRQLLALQRAQTTAAWMQFALMLVLGISLIALLVRP